MAVAKTLKKTETPSFVFGGFKALTSTPIPDEFFDWLALRLSEAELRVLLYIMRRTFGFNKRSDAISLSQLTNGIKRRDGSILDQGTGLSKPAVLKAITGLSEKNIIKVEKNLGVDGRNEINIYSLNFAEQNNPTFRDVSDNNFYSKNEYTKQNYSITNCDSQFNSVEVMATQFEQEAVEESKIVKIKGVPNRVTHIIPKTVDDGNITLPTRVNLVNQESKQNGLGRVNQHDQQHDRIKNKIQENNKQVLCVRSPLAMQSEEDNQVEVTIDGDLLYINFRKLVLAMSELGLSEEIATNYAYSYPDDYLWEKINLTKELAKGKAHQKVLYNTVGYLRRAIEEDYKPRISEKKPLSFCQKTVPSSLTTSPANSPEIKPPSTLLREVSKRAATLSTVSNCQAPDGAVGIKEAYFLQENNLDFLDSIEPTILWETILQDLEGRFRVNSSTMSLLEGSFLEIKSSKELLIWLASPWQERSLSLIVRNQIKLALRQHLGVSYSILFNVLET